MVTNKDLIPIVEEKTPIVSPGTYSPVTVHMKDTMGTIFLGILACILLIGWMFAETRNRGLMAQSKAADGSHTLNPG